MFNSIHEECGVFGIFEPKPKMVGDITYLGLFALQHRGQEACGIAVCDDGIMRYHKGIGLVGDVFNKESLASLGMGNMAVGHVRYSTTGGNNMNNIQPLIVNHIKGNLALAHNGNLTNAQELRHKFELEGAIFRATSDTEDIAYQIVKERLKTKSIEEAIKNAMKEIKGAYSCVAMSSQKLIAFRDKNGFRPLILGKTQTGGYIVASESSAIDAVNGTIIRDIKPGEILTISKEGIKSDFLPNASSSLCIFEFIYFARPDSIIEGTSVHKARLNAGKILAKESPVDADIVIGVPDSGIDAAIGYALESKIPYGVGFVKNKYMGRSFIKPTQEERNITVKIKLNVIKETIENKRVILIDDSIVRGTTSAHIIKLLKDNGAKEVHLRISAPPFKHPCYFGTDIDSEENLIACKYKSTDEIAKVIGADSLAYLSLDGAHNLAENSKCHFCDGCFSGKYPIDVPKESYKDKFEEKINK